MSQEIEFMLTRLYDSINSVHLREHERDFIESLFRKVVYSRRAADATEIKTIQKLYQMFLLRQAKD